MLMSPPTLGQDVGLYAPLSVEPPDAAVQAMPVVPSGTGAPDPAVAAGWVTPAQFDTARRKRAALLELGQDTHVYDLLVRDRFLSRDRAAELRGRLQSGALDEVRSLLPMALCERCQVAPVALEDGQLRVMAARPLSLGEKRALMEACATAVTGLRVTPVDRATVQREIRRLHAQVAVVASVLQQMRGAEVNAGALSEFVTAMLTEALRARASDIHLDLQPDPDAWISYRVDGLLQQRHQVPERVMAAIFTRLKTDTGMDASNARSAQDGRLSLEFAGRHIDFRVASQPLAQGETIALRVLDPESLPSIESLFPAAPEMTERLRAVSTVQGKTGGLLLFSGPTGSGKTTTLYAVSQSFPRDRINVVTVEDPVEYTLPFARQIQINQLREERTTDVERSILRQDPDVIVFGEIRDGDSARAALKFTESGHMVLATIHATTALQTFERFISFFEESAKREALFVMAHSLRLLFSQRLAQRLCRCARASTPADGPAIAEVLRDTGIALPAGTPLRLRTGCARCSQSGIFGRVLAYETLAVSADEHARSEMVRALEQSHGNFSGITRVDGVDFTPRVQALEQLLRAGEIDPLSARRALGL